MNYNKYLKNGLILNEFNTAEEMYNVDQAFKDKETQLGNDWKNKSSLAKDVLIKNAPLTDDDKKILSNAIQSGETYTKEILNKYLADDGSVPDFIYDLHKSLLGKGPDPENSVPGLLAKFKKKLSSENSTDNEENTPKGKLKKLLNDKDPIIETYKVTYEALKKAFNDANEPLKIETIEDAASGQPIREDYSEDIISQSKAYISTLKLLGDKIGIKDLNKKQLDDLLKEIKGDDEPQDQENEVSSDQQNTETQNPETEDESNSDDDLFDEIEYYIVQYYGVLNSAEGLRNFYITANKAGDINKANQYRVEIQNIPSKADSIISSNFENLKFSFSQYNINVTDIESVKKEFEKLYNSHKEDVDADIEQAELNQLPEEEQEQFQGSVNRLLQQETPLDRETFYQGMVLFAKYVRAIELLEKSAKKDKVIGSVVDNLLTATATIGGIMNFASGFVPSPYKEMLKFTGMAIGFGAGSIKSVKAGTDDWKNGKKGTALLKFSLGGILGYMACKYGKNAVNTIENTQIANFLGGLKEPNVYKNQLNSIDSQLKSKQDLIDSGTLDKAGLRQAQWDMKKLNGQKMLVSNQYQGALAKANDPNAVNQFISDVKSGKIDVLTKSAKDNKASIMKSVNSSLADLNSNADQTINLAIEDSERTAIFDANTAYKSDPNGITTEMVHKYGTDGGWYANVMRNGTEKEKALAPIVLEGINKSDAGKAEIALRKVIAQGNQMIAQGQNMGPLAKEKNAQAFADVLTNSKFGKAITNKLNGDPDKTKAAYKTVFNTILKHNDTPITNDELLKGLMNDGLSEKESKGVIGVFFRNKSNGLNIKKPDLFYNTISTADGNNLITEVDNAFENGLRMVQNGLSTRTNTQNKINGFWSGPIDLSRKVTI